MTPEEKPPVTWPLLFRRAGLSLRKLGLLLLLFGAAIVLWCVIWILDAADYALEWWHDLSVRRLPGWRFLLGFSVIPGNPACCCGYRQLYLGRWLLEWRID